MTENVCDWCGERPAQRPTGECDFCWHLPGHVGEHEPTLEEEAFQENYERLLAFVRKIADFSGDEIGLTYYEVKALAREARDLVAASGVSGHGHEETGDESGE